MRAWRQVMVVVVAAAVCALLFAEAASAAEADFPEDRLVYRASGPGECEVVGVSQEGELWQVIDIPETAGGLRVTGIAAGAFEDQDLIRTVTIPDSVVRIGEDAFRHCNNLRNIVLPPGLEELGARAFWMCGQLLEINIPAGLTDIREGTFFACDIIKEVSVPEGVRTLGEAAFASCRELAAVELPSTLESIGSRCFEACAHLVRINMPSAVTSLGDAAFAHCMRLPEIQLPEGITGIGDRTFVGCGALRSFAVPESVGRIGAEAFRSCVELREFAIDGHPASVGAQAFAYCGKLSGIAFPEGLRSIGSGAFLNVPIQVSLPETLVSIGDDAFNAEGCIVTYAGSPGMWQSVMIGTGNDGIAEIHYGREDGPGGSLDAAADSGLAVEMLPGTSVAVVRGLEAGRTAPAAGRLYAGITAPDGTIEVFAADGTLLGADDPAATGCIVQASGPDGAFLGRAYVVVSGDVLGTGVINVGQLVAVAQALSGQRDLSPLELAAVDQNGSGAVDIADLVHEAQMLLRAG